MKENPVWITILFFGLAACAPALDLKNEGDAKWGWQAFGHGVDDSGVKKSENAYWVAVNWPGSSWGNGMYYRFPDGAMDVTPFKKVSVKVASASPTQAKFRIEILTADNAVFGMDPSSGVTLGADGETLIEAEISSMVPVQAEQGQREFDPAQDLKKVNRVQIIFLKPDDPSEGKNMLSFKEMKLE